MNFNRFKEFLDLASNTNSNLEKEKIVEKFEDLREVFILALDPTIQYYITPQNLEKNKNITVENTFEASEILKLLSERKISGNNAIGIVNFWLSQNLDKADMFKLILEKNLKCRVDAKMVNKIFPGLIFSFDVALAKPLEEELDFKKDKWYGSHKIDGTRLLTIIGDSDIKFYSRSGIEFLTLAKLRDDITRLGLSNVVLDGEACIVDENGVESFQAIMKEIKKKDHIIQNPKYKIFDIIDLQDFKDKVGDVKFSDRYSALKSLNLEGLQTLEILDQTLVRDSEHFEALKKEAEIKGWEGLILRKDVGYEGKRTKNLLKVKTFCDAEYEVVDVEFGKMRILNKITKLEEELDVLAAVIIEHKGQLVNVGSGFTQEQRLEFYKNPELIKGKIITVQFFEESKDQFGNISLRFPVFKHLYEGERDL